MNIIKKMFGKISNNYEYTGIGVLSQRELDYIPDMLKKYPFAIELKHSLNHKWTNENLLLYDDVAEDCMGNNYSRKTQMWGYIQREDSGFMFLKSKKEYQLIVDTFPELIIDKNPFKTIFSC